MFGSPLMAESFQACFFELRLIEIEADLIACHACLDMIQFANKSDLDFKEVNANFNFLGAKDPGFCFLEIFCMQLILVKVVMDPNFAYLPFHFLLWVSRALK